MPQELALYTEFTIRETYQYFGRIYKMSAKDVLNQMEFLTNLLDLPPSHRTVGTLRYHNSKLWEGSLRNIFQWRTAAQGLFCNLTSPQPRTDHFR